MKKIWFFILSLFILPLVFSLSANASPANSITYNQMGAFFSRTSSYNPISQVINTSAGSLPRYIMTNYDQTVKAFSFGSNSFSLPSPLGSQSGISYNIDVSFELLISGADFSYSLANDLFGYARFNEGSISKENSTITVERINSNRVKFNINSSVNLVNSINLSTVYVYIQNSSNSIGHCSNYPQAMISLCGSDGQAVQLRNVDISVTVSQDPNTALLGQISQQNLTIINQNDQSITQQVITNNKLDTMTNSINEQTQQEQQHYEQEKQEERDRETSASGSTSQITDNFNFSVLNPLANFDWSDGCVSVPTIASWLHLSNSQVCPFFSKNVRDAISPIFSIFSTLLIFSVIFRWLGKDVIL